MIAQVVTVTVKEQVPSRLLGLASLTVQVTVVVPTGKLDPEAGTQFGAPTPGQLSLTVGAGKFTVTGLPLAEAAV